jgi:hypothetical protein
MLAKSLLFLPPEIAEIQYLCQCRTFLKHTNSLVHITFFLHCRCICLRLSRSWRCLGRCRQRHHCRCCCHHCPYLWRCHNCCFHHRYCCRSLVDCCLPPTLPLFLPAAAFTCLRCCCCCLLAPLPLPPRPQPLPLFLLPPPPPLLPIFLPLALLPLCFHHCCLCFCCCHVTISDSITTVSPLLFPMPSPQ